MDIKQHIILHKKIHEKIDYKIYTNCQNIMEKKKHKHKNVITWSQHKTMMNKHCKH